MEGGKMNGRGSVLHEVAVPSAMKELVKTKAVWAGRTIDERFQQAYKEYRLWTKKEKVHSKCTKPFLKKHWMKHKYPQISQFVMKGAALRRMIDWMCEVCDKHTATPHDQLRAVMFKSFQKADR
eukprot:9992886-Karenia_brevis.AAC.1